MRHCTSRRAPSHAPGPVTPLLALVFAALHGRGLDGAVRGGMRQQAGGPSLGVHIFKEPGPALEAGLGTTQQHAPPNASQTPRNPECLLSQTYLGDGGRSTEEGGWWLTGGMRPFMASGDSSQAGPFQEPPILSTGVSHQRVSQKPGDPGPGHGCTCCLPPQGPTIAPLSLM